MIPIFLNKTENANFQFSLGVMQKFWEGKFKSQNPAQLLVTGLLLEVDPSALSGDLM